MLSLGRRTPSSKLRYAMQNSRASKHVFAAGKRDGGTRTAGFCTVQHSVCTKITNMVLHKMFVAVFFLQILPDMSRKNLPGDWRVFLDIMRAETL